MEIVEREKFVGGTVVLLWEWETEVVVNVVLEVTGESFWQDVEGEGKVLEAGGGDRKGEEGAVS